MSPAAAPQSRAWWEGRGYALALIALSALPLLWPTVPPLVDLPGHIGRYRVQLGGEEAADLARFYGFQWGVLANLGVDLLVEALGPLLGLERAVKLIVLAIPPITVAGLLGVAREAHGRTPATAAFALPLAWGYPFQFGFVNFALAMGLAFCAFALWLRMGRLGAMRLRGALFLGIGVVIWFTHIFGWGVLGLLVFAAELVRRWRAGHRWTAGLRAGLACWPLWPPILLMIAWRGDASGVTADFFNWNVKNIWLASILRERWFAWDIACAVIVLVIAVAGLRERRFAKSGLLVIAAAMLGLTYLLLPRILLGSAYADMRLIPAVVACAILAASPVRLARRWQGRFAAAATTFFVVRVVVSTAALALTSAAWERQLPALDHVRPGSRVLALAAIACQREWRTSRMEHLSSFATFRRDAFVNDQWSMPGAQLLTVRYRGGGAFTGDPSQIVRPRRRCMSRAEHLLEPALAEFPRDAFDYLWLIDVPPSRRPVDPGLVPLWFGAETGALYRVVPGRDHTTRGPGRVREDQVAGVTPGATVGPGSRPIGF